MKPPQTPARTSVATRVERVIDELAAELVSLTRELVRIPSTPGHEQNAQRAIARRYELLGLETEIVPSIREELQGHPAFSDDGIPFVDRLNVVATWRGKGGGRSLILNGHMDVVPPGDTAKWTHDPWGGEVNGDRLYGRGSCDMKAGLAAGAIAVQALKSMGITPGGDVTLQSVIGEESGGIGTLTTIVRGFRADSCIIMEPMGLGIVPVHSGAMTFRLTVHGRGAHASMKSLGVSAIEEFVPLLRALQRLNHERHRRFEHPLYDADRDIAPISVGTVKAGNWPSTVPDMLVAEGRIGAFPDESLDEARAEVRSAIDAAASEDPWLSHNPPVLEWFEGQFEPGVTPTDSPIVRTLSACHAQVTGSVPPIFGIPSGTDLRLFTRHAGIPTVLYGPGSLLQAHGTDEFVSIDEAITCAKVLARTILEWCGS